MGLAYAAGVFRMSATRNHAGEDREPVNIKVHLCIPDDQMKHLPKRRRAPAYLPADAPLPRQGEVLYLSSSSAWAVTMVIHSWNSPSELRIEVWLVHVATSRESRPTGFALTQ